MSFYKNVGIDMKRIVSDCVDKGRCSVYTYSPRGTVRIETDYINPNRERYIRVGILVGQLHTKYIYFCIPLKQDIFSRAFLRACTPENMFNEPNKYRLMVIYTEIAGECHLNISLFTNEVDTHINIIETLSIMFVRTEDSAEPKHISCAKTGDIYEISNIIIY